MYPPRLLLVLLCLLLPALRAADEPSTRTWTDLKGRTLEAELTGVDAAGRALLRIFDKPVPVDPKTLCEADRRYIKNWVADRKLHALSATTTSMLEQAAKPPAAPLQVVNPRTYKPPPSGFFARSQAEIKDALSAIDSRKDAGVQPGEQKALNRLNGFRYLCGLPHGVTINREFQPFVDAGARICKAIGRLDHGPPNPGWAEDEYEKARKGTGSSNLFATSGGGGIEIAASSVNAYLDDGATNPNLGHRRWCLNPRMGATAFGAFEGYSAMWAMDGSGPSVDWEYVAFPAPGYFPSDFFGRRYQWNVTLNPKLFDGYQKLTAEQVRVYDLHRNQDVPDDKMTPLKLEYFNVDLGGYGVPNSIGFLPEDVDIDKGSRYRVEIHGLDRKGKDGPLVYLVEFF